MLWSAKIKYIIIIQHEVALRGPAQCMVCFWGFHWPEDVPGGFIGIIIYQNNVVDMAILFYIDHPRFAADHLRF